MEERVAKLTDLSFKKPMIRLNPDKFRTFIGAKGVGQPARNYSFIVMMTALSPMRQCSVCRSAADEFAIVANSWRYGQGFSNSLFFGLVDYDEGADIFSALGLNSAPVFLFFGERAAKSTGFSIRSAEQMDIQRIGFAAETVARWVFEKTNISVRVVRPPNYTASFLLLVLFSLLSVLLYVRRNNLDFLYNKTSWALIALVSDFFIFGFERDKLINFELSFYPVNRLCDDLRSDVEPHSQPAAAAPLQQGHQLHSQRQQWPVHH